MLQFHCAVLSGQSCDSSTGQEERASVERRIAAGHLKDTVGLTKRKREKTTNVSSCSSRLTFGEEQLRVEVSTGDICAA